SFVFGYLNRNYEEQPEIPVGAANIFSPGVPDRGQPTHFYPRRPQFMFKVTVPADWGTKELVWTIARNGQTEKAVAHLALEWELSEVVYSQNRVGLAQDSGTPLPNKAPSVTIDGGGNLRASVGVPLMLSATATDDGIPKIPQRGAAQTAAAAPQGAPATPPGAAAPQRGDAGGRGATPPATGAGATANPTGAATGTANRGR